jgi:hypothetical protein
MRNSLKITTAALAIAGMGLAWQPAAAAPVASNTAALKAAAPDATVDVRYRRYGGWGHRRWGAGPFVAGAALGLIGAGIAASTWPGYYYDEPYYYAPRAYYAHPYAYSYGYAPYGWGPYYGRERFW